VRRALFLLPAIFLLAGCKSDPSDMRVTHIEATPDSFVIFDDYDNHPLVGLPQACPSISQTNGRILYIDKDTVLVYCKVNG
jgi:hypothetical protein